ncbi:hypothetical protein [Streptomyces sp. NPDC050856]|uniref:hypothetical protein n=1 Tax=Streptomyces sp. NPDC050856 TaxID=3154939 RepID=UPI00340334A6
MVLPGSSLPAADPDFRPTHVVPRDGLPTWEAPDPSRPSVPLDPFLPVELVDRLGDWALVACSNGWSAWVDGRLLVSVPPDPPVAGQPMARTADPGPLLARVEESLSRYRQAAGDLAAGRGDGDTFRRRTRGLRVGLVVDGEGLWLYEAEHERWVYCDGTRLSTYAAPAGPSAAAGPAAPNADGAAPTAGYRPTQLAEQPTGPAQGPVPAAGRGSAPARGPSAARGADAEPTRLVERAGEAGRPSGPAGEER